MNRRAGSNWVSACALVLAMAAAGRAHAFSGYVQEDVGAPGTDPWLVSAPAAASFARLDAPVWRPGPIYTFAQGFDGALWARLYDGGWWSWVTLDGEIESRPAATATGPQQIAVAAVGTTDNHVWLRRYDGVWQGWQRIEGLTTRIAPALTSHGDGTIDAFAVGIDSHVYTAHFDGTAWQPWVNLAGVATGAPSAVANDDGSIDVFVRGSDGAVWHRSHRLMSSGGAWVYGWTSWQWLDGWIMGDTAVAHTPDGKIDVFARGGDSAIWQLTWDPALASDGTTTTGWNIWTRIDAIGPVSSDPAVVDAQADGRDPCRYHLFARDASTYDLDRYFCVQDASLIPIYRQLRLAFGSAIFDTLLTADKSELGVPSDPPLGWAHDGVGFLCHGGPYPGTVPLYRLYDVHTQVHTSTADPSRKAAKLAAGAIDEGITCFVRPPSDAPGWFGPDGTCALWDIEHYDNNPYYTVDAYMALNNTADGSWHFFDHGAWPDFGRLGFAYSKNGACGIMDEGPTATTPPPPPPDDDRPRFNLLPVGIYAGNYAFLGETSGGFSSAKVVKHITVSLPPLKKPEFSVGFVKAGRYSSECSDPSAVVWVSQGDELPPSRFAEVFGTSSVPYAGLRIAACGLHIGTPWADPLPIIALDLILGPP